MNTRSETLYRSAAAEGATYIGLLLVVYDSLAEDLRRAAKAVSRNDIAGRCNASNHALLLLGHLESWTSSIDDPALRDSLSQFYAYLRSRTLAIQAQPQPEPFEELARLVGETRAAWQQKEALSRPAPAVANHTVMPHPADAGEDSPRLSWSA